MQLQIRDICKLLNVSERTVYRWIKSGAIPHYKLNEQYRFNRVEILEWATAQKMTVSPEIFAEPESGDLPALSAAIEAGGIHYRVSGRDKESVLRSIVRQMRLPEGVDVDFLLQVLLARESLGSTAIGDGVGAIFSQDGFAGVRRCFARSGRDAGGLRPGQCAGDSRGAACRSRRCDRRLR